jgi:hypothetical protein
MADETESNSEPKDTPMIRTKIVALTLAVAATAATAATSANASPHFPRLHRHPGAPQTQDARLTVHVFNPNVVAREVKVDGRVFTLAPHQMLSIKAPAGTNVYAEDAGRLHRKGDVLFAVGPQVQEKTLSLNEIN